VGGKRKSKFFKINIGLDDGYGKPDYTTLTPLFLELKMCYEYLHITHEEYLELSSLEKQKVVLFEQMKRERKIYQDQEEVKAIRKQQNKIKNKYNMVKG